MGRVVVDRVVVGRVAVRELGARLAALVGGASSPRRGPGFDYGALTAAIRESAADQGRTLDPGQDRALTEIAAIHEQVGGSRSLYLFGDVGRGKSWIADELFSRVPLPKRRLHAHELLEEINAALAGRKQQPAYAGPQVGPGGRPGVGELIASMVEDVDFVLLDDFHVHDVADGRLLVRTLRALVENSTHLVLTSNYAPEGLMPNPLFHETFRGGIDLIEQHCEIVRIAEGPDHRRHASHGTGFSRGTWSVVGPDEHQPRPGSTALRVGPRTLLAEIDGECLSVSFAQLCQRPWAASDYLGLTERFRRVRITQMPPFDDVDEEAAQRFAHLIDVLADRDVRLDVHSLVDREALALSANLPRDAERMLSRLALLTPGSRRPRGTC